MDFWSRFGYIWKLNPHISGIYDVERITILQVESAVLFNWENNNITPLELAESRFNSAFAHENQSLPQIKKIREFHNLYLQAVQLRKQQWTALNTAA